MAENRLQEEKQRGISQDSLEDLRSEFLSIGGIVASLPDPKAVRDNTIVMIRDLSFKVEVYNRWQMINGKWYWIGKATPAEPYHITGSLDQKNTGTTISLSGVATNALLPIDSGWTKTLTENIISRDAGKLQVESDGEYIIMWAMGITCTSANKAFEAGLMVNGSENASGWAEVMLSTANAELVLSTQTIVQLKKGDQLSLSIRCTSSPTADVNIEHANFIAMKRGI